MIKEKRFIKVRQRQVRKLDNLINKKECNITWQSSQVPPATRAFPWPNNRQTGIIVLAGNNIQAGRSTVIASPQASQPSLGERALPQSHFSQAGRSQASPGDSTLSPAESELSQAGNSQASPVDSTLLPAESELSLAGNSQASLVDLKKFCGILPYFGSPSYLYQRMPMGLNISPAIWQSYINAILNCLQSRKYCEAIMDDLLLFTPMKSSHFEKMEDLLKALCKNGLKISPKKCQLFKTDHQYMGNTIFIRKKRVCLRPLRSQIEAI